MGGLSHPMRGLKYGWRCTMKTGKHTKRDLHLKTGGEFGMFQWWRFGPLALPSATPSSLLSRYISFLIYLNNISYDFFMP